MYYKEIESYFLQFKRTHTWTELVEEVLRLHTGKEADLTEIFTKVANIQQDDFCMPVDTFDKIVRARCREKIVEQIETFTGEKNIRTLCLPSADITYVGNLVLSALQEEAPFFFMNLIELTEYEKSAYVYEKLYYLTGAALNACRNRKKLASILLTLADSLLFKAHVLFTVDQDAYMAEKPTERSFRTIVNDGIRFFSGDIATL